MAEKQKHTPEDVDKRMKLQWDEFQTDAKIYRLQAEKLEKLQELINLEMNMYGRVSKNTALIMSVENCEIINGTVREMTLYERALNQEKAESVHGKLDHYKEDVKKQSDNRSKVEQKRETPEIG